jgi:predicted transcriptional regulator
MTATTPLKLPDDLKARIATAADLAGKSPHAFMMEALRAQTELAEMRQHFVADALLAREEVAQYGLVYDSDEVFSYVKARLEGEPAERPAPHKL